ncbi:glucokinase [Mesorhizobium sp. L-8-3]|uniref:glucokinase n=1 Tax=Mesorhizobium sp. L-8-3 TaxID=2744522 RepID=UPI0019279419|nr:glucokinase [Mesorhizobium sp. L-8-3]BCH27704.1 glucokinase [Mesorhizobium sp. L-8-3]
MKGDTVISLACDIGGTNTRLGLVENDRLIGETLSSFANEAFGDFDALLDTYLASTAARSLTSVCIALAGVATPEGARLTNRDWTIRRADVARLTGASDVGFINDFEALGFALMRVDALETQPILVPGEPVSSSGTRMVLGAGTGFNAAACHPPRFGGEPHVAAAECGHMTLPLAGEQEFELQRKLSKGRGRASVERALSGNGLREIHQWVCERNGRDPAGRSAAEISRLAVSQADPDCIEAADMFLRLLGRVVGDLALAYLPTSGIYLSGGVSRALAPLMTSTPTFRQSFLAKGRMSSFMESFPVALLTDDRAALAGCVEWLLSSRYSR